MNTGNFPTALWVVLGIAVICIILIGKNVLAGNKAKASMADVKNIDSAETAMAAAESANQESMNDDALIAVITAAVAACMGTESNLVVRSIRRIEDMTPVWGKASKQEQMANRF